MSTTDSPPQTPASAPAPSDDVTTLVRQRRAKLAAAQRPADEAGTWGLALSGGGIRSATFCFGLLKALAKNKVLHRFDLLSTVSGGGYIGATVGKLFHNAATTGQAPQDVEEALADADTRWFAFWLRANGRYLIPRGGKDLLFAAANFSRNLVGVHIELALLCLLAGCVLVGLDLAVWQWADCVLSGNGCWQPAWVTLATLDALADWPTLWVLLPPLLLAATSLATAYWALPAAPGARLPLQRWLMVLFCVLGCWLLVRHWTLQQQPSDRSDTLQVPGWLLLVAGGMLCAWVIGTVVAQWLTLRHADAPDQSRHRLTAALARVLNAVLIVAALGLVDVMAWLLASAKGDHQGAIGSVVLLTVVALRAVLPKIADLPRSLTPGTRINLDGLINLAGVVTLAALLVFWVSVVHRSATFVLFDETRRVLQFALGWNWLAVIAVPVLLMIGISFRNRDFLNRSSLYAFYRARLVRSYLGATNVQRFRGTLKAATETYSRHVAAGGPSVSVQDVHADDDVPLADYAPHNGGGPVHLINACVNQTRDPRGGLFNQDRKGVLMTVAPQGRVRVGQDGWRRMHGPDSLTLGSWVAISGAAVAPGLGSSTKSGIAALLTMSGVRLGYWWNALALQRAPGEATPRHVGKYAQLLAELRGRFDGLRRADWYLTDGGHFENTGVYALLREECALVVVADCGADPRYAFGDLENLVRKARIDLQADIVFLKPRLPQPAPAAAASEAGDDSITVRSTPAEGAPSVFGSLNDLVSTDSQACLALASIRYRSGKTGHLVVVKPNMCAGVPVDLVNYKADHPLFPQEPTTDQFFSETQWESYFQLGQTLGLNLQRHLLDDLPTVADLRFEVDDGSVVVRDEKSGQLHAASAPKRLPSRIAATGAVTASVSLGALATLGATTWQTVDQQMQTREKARRLDPAVLKELTDLYGKLMPDVPPASAMTVLPAGQVIGKADPAAADKTPTRLGEMATALLRIGDAACTLDNTEAFRRSTLMQMILTGTKQSCRDMRPRHPSCEVLLDPEQPVACLRERAQVSCAPRYWLRDFGERDPGKQNCLVTPPPAPAPAGTAGADMSDQLIILSPAAILEWLGLRDAEEAPPSAGAPAELPETPTDGNSPPSSPDRAAASSGGIGGSIGGGAGIPTGMPPRALPTPAPRAVPDAPRVCAGRTVYIQIYGPEMREQMRQLRQPWEALGANLPPMEDVWDSARRRGRASPKAPTRPTVIYHDAASRACAEKLPPANEAGRWAVTPLSSRLTGTPGVIEVWVPPALTPTVGTASATLPGSSFCYQEDSGQSGAQRYGVHCHVDLGACEKARGPNPGRVQSACMAVDTSAQAGLLNRRGWGGSWYAMRPLPFGEPFPQLP